MRIGSTATIVIPSAATNGTILTTPATQTGPSEHAPVALGVARLPDRVGSLAEFESALDELIVESSGCRVDHDDAAGRERAATRAHSALRDAVISPDRTDEILAGLGVDFFEETCGWRELFTRLIGAPDIPRDYKLVALARYRRFLRGRARDGDGRQAGRARDEADSASGASNRSGARTVWCGSEGREAPAGRGRRPDLVQRLRVTPRQSLRISVRGSGMRIWLASRAFVIAPGGPPRLVDPEGAGHALRDGRNLVGRAAFADVVVDSGYQDVSRSHAIIDVEDGRPVALTDLSSSGTYVTPEDVRGSNRAA